MRNHRLFAFDLFAIYSNQVQITSGTQFIAIDHFLCSS